MAKTYRLAATQPVAPPCKPECNPYDDRYDPERAGEHIESCISCQLKLFEEAGRNKADLVVGTESMTGIGLYSGYLRDQSPFFKHIETIPGPTSRRIAKIAKKYHMYIVACYTEKAGRKFHNTAVLFGRNGRIVGKYRKVQLTTSERWLLSPGNSYPVFKTELGNIGILICHDISFPEIARCLTLQGADILCFPTNGYGKTEDIGESCMKTRCVDYGVHLIVSHFKRSSIINPWGDVLADAGHRNNVVVYADIDPKAGQHVEPNNYWSIITGTHDHRERYVKQRRPEMYKLITAKNPPILKRYKRKDFPEGPEERWAIFEKVEADRRAIVKGMAKRYV